jgi:formamidopyrimidine-DNA glycosylase
MPELPEVETTRRGVEPHVVGRRLERLLVHDRRLRWPVRADLPKLLAGQRFISAGRRAKYLLLELERGTLILHLGMSGSLRVLPTETPRLTHDHLDFELLTSIHSSPISHRSPSPRPSTATIFGASRANGALRSSSSS